MTWKIHHWISLIWGFKSTLQRCPKVYSCKYIETTCWYYTLMLRWWDIHSTWRSGGCLRLGKRDMWQDMCSESVQNLSVIECYWAAEPFRFRIIVIYVVMCSTRNILHPLISCRSTILCVQLREYLYNIHLESTKAISKDGQDFTCTVQGANMMNTVSAQLFMYSLEHITRT